jgi:hypothetical protein
MGLERGGEVCSPEIITAMGIQKLSEGREQRLHHREWATEGQEGKQKKPAKKITSLTVCLQLAFVLLNHRNTYHIESNILLLPPGTFFFNCSFSELRRVKFKDLVRLSCLELATLTFRWRLHKAILKWFQKLVTLGAGSPVWVPESILCHVWAKH